MTKARDLSKLLSTSNGKIAGSNLDVSFENISDTGTEGTKVASGTTAQRGSTTGQWRYNTTTESFEGRNTDGTFSTLIPDPTVSSVDDTEVDSAAGGNQTIVVTGTNFSSGGTIAFVGSSAEFDATTTTFDSVTQVTAVAPKSSFLNAQEPYKVRFTSASGKIGISSGLINVDNEPTWSTNSGSLGNLIETQTANISTSATDAEGDTVSYSIQSGSLPSGLSLNTSSGAITGTASAVGSDTTSNFTLRATANSKTADRAFSILVKNESYTNTNLKVYNSDNCSDSGHIPGSTFGGDTSVTTDMGSAKKVRGFFAYSVVGAARAGALTVSGSNDNSNFTTIFTGSNSASVCGVYYVSNNRSLSDVLNSSYRYIRVEFGSATNGHHPRISRFGVETLNE
jgi:hypothetical protein